MDKYPPNVLSTPYEAWKAKRRFLLGESRPLTAWAKRRAKAEQQAALQKRLELRSARRFVITD